MRRVSVWFKKLARGELAQASLEYAGMIAAAAVLIGAVIFAAQGWGDTLVCKISNAINGGGGCAASSQSMVPDKVQTNSSSVTEKTEADVLVPVNPSAKLGGGYDGKDSVKLLSYGDGSVRLEVTSSDGGHLGGEIGTEKGSPVKARGELKAGGAVSNKTIYECQAGDTACVEALKQEMEKRRVSGQANGIERLRDGNGKDIEPTENWSGGKLNLGLEGELGLEAGVEEGGSTVKLESGAELKLDSEYEWSRNSVNGDTRNTFSGTFDLGAKAEATFETTLDKGLPSEGTLPEASAQVKASTKGAYQIITQRDKDGNIIGYRLITSREVTSTSKLGLKSKGVDEDNVKAGINAGLTETVVTTTDLKLADIKDPALRAAVQDELSNNLGGKNPINIVEAVSKGGMYTTKPGDNNPVGQALYESGRTTVQTSSVDRTKAEDGIDLWVVKYSHEATVEDSKVTSTQYLGEADSSGVRHIKTYEP